MLKEENHLNGDHLLSSTLTVEGFYEKSERKQRLSFDVDKEHLQEDPFKVLRIFFTLKRFFPNSQVTVKRTLRGYHIKAVGEEIEKIPIEKRIKIRETLTDDSDRVRSDYAKFYAGLYYCVDTLFTMKVHKDKRIGKEEEVNPLALPWWIAKE